MLSRTPPTFLAMLLVMLPTLLSGAEEVEFFRDVYPILERHCVGCHSDDDPEGGFAIETFAGILQGGDSGAALTPGVPASSRMLLMVRGQLEPLMPPEGEQRLDENELAVLERWIEAGAAGPDGDMPIKRSLITPKIEPVTTSPEPITAIARSTDGSRVATATFGKIEVTGPTDTPLQIHDDDLGKINSLEFSRDGQSLLVASGLTGAYGRAAIYSTANGKLQSEFVGHRDILYDAEFSPDESQVATAGYDRKIFLWDIQTQAQTGEFLGHNGAIFDLAFSPDGKVLASACADETVKVWSVAHRTRLDTLGQPEGEVFAVEFTADGKYIIAGSADNRLRVWKLQSIDAPAINPLLATRFIDETPIIDFAFCPDNRFLVALVESGNVKLIRTSDWQPVKSIRPLGESGTDLFVGRDGRSVTVALMNGRLAKRQLPPIDDPKLSSTRQSTKPVLMDLGVPKTLIEAELRERVKTNGSLAGTELDATIAPLDVARNVLINGKISHASQADLYRWKANRGERWAIDADAIEGSRLDPIVTVLDSASSPVLRTRLQAIRDSYFTFRGKDSSQINDFRVFNWQEMKLGQYFYAAGEVTRLQMHPRGPDSGFEMYPGEGTRWTYFGTSGTTHALGEPAYIVKPLPPGSSPTANGLPVFEIAYENDDDPMRVHGKNSRLLFTAPADGHYSIRITDTRGEGGDDYDYQLAIRPAAPAFRPMTTSITKSLHPATGREFRVQIDRIDGFDGPVTFEIDGLPDGLRSNFPVVVEREQRFATAMIWADPAEKGWNGEIEPTLTAWAMIDSKRVERPVIGSPGKLKFDPEPAQVIAVIEPVQSVVGKFENWTLRVKRGHTVSARVLIERNNGFKNEVSFGKERAGRNACQGVYVDNIGLNGLLILADANEREFFLTADETAVPGKRSFFLTATTDGGLTSHPITVEVLP